MIHFTAPTLRRIKMEVSQLNQQSLGSKVRKGRENLTSPVDDCGCFKKAGYIYIYIYKTPRFHGYEKNAIRTSNFCKNSTNSESACFPRLLGDVRIEGAMGTHGTPSFFEGFWKL